MVDDRALDLGGRDAADWACAGPAADIACAEHRGGGPQQTATGEVDVGSADAAVCRGVDRAAAVEFLLYG